MCLQVVHVAAGQDVKYANATVITRECRQSIVNETEVENRLDAGGQLRCLKRATLHQNRVSENIRCQQVLAITRKCQVEGTILKGNRPPFLHRVAIYESNHVSTVCDCDDLMRGRGCNCSDALVSFNHVANIMSWHAAELHPRLAFAINKIDGRISGWF